MAVSHPVARPIDAVIKLGGDVLEGEALADVAADIARARAGRRLLIVHGMRDTNVSPGNTLAAVRDLDKAGIPYELLTFDNEGHGINRAGNRELLLRRVAEFFEESFAQERR